MDRPINRRMNEQKNGYMNSVDGITDKTGRCVDGR